MPKPFFTKLVAISAIGFFCVLFGCIFGIATHDRLFILMSLLIGICSILRALSCKAQAEEIVKAELIYD